MEYRPSEFYSIMLDGVLASVLVMFMLFIHTVEPVALPICIHTSHGFRLVRDMIDLKKTDYSPKPPDGSDHKINITDSKCSGVNKSTLGLYWDIHTTSDSRINASSMVLCMKMMSPSITTIVCYRMTSNSGPPVQIQCSIPVTNRTFIVHAFFTVQVGRDKLNYFGQQLISSNTNSCRWSCDSVNIRPRLIFPRRGTGMVTYDHVTLEPLGVLIYTHGWIRHTKKSTTGIEFNIGDLPPGNYTLRVMMGRKGSPLDICSYDTMITVAGGPPPTPMLYTKSSVSSAPSAATPYALIAGSVVTTVVVGIIFGIVLYYYSRRIGSSRQRPDTGSIQNNHVPVNGEIHEMQDLLPSGEQYLADKRMSADIIEELKAINEME